MREVHRKRAIRKEGGTPAFISSERAKTPRSYLDNIEEQPERGSIRVYFQNINTIKIGGEAIEDIEALKKLAAVGASIIGLSEVNKNMEDGETKKAVEEVIRKEKPGMTMCAGGNTFYRTTEVRNQGGVAMITRQCVDKYILKRKVDLKGRWAVVDMRIGDDRLSVYNVYVPLKDDRGGPTTVRRQLQNALDEEGIDEDLIDNLYKEMSEEISEDIEEGKNVIVGGDFNETCEEDGLMSKTMEKIGLVNYFKRRMGVVPPIRRPGKRAIDHVWVTPGAFSAVNRAGIVG